MTTLHCSLIFRLSGAMAPTTDPNRNVTNTVLGWLAQLQELRKQILSSNVLYCRPIVNAVHVRMNMQAQTILRYSYIGLYACTLAATVAACWRLTTELPQAYIICQFHYIRPNPSCRIFGSPSMADHNHNRNVQAELVRLQDAYPANNMAKRYLINSMEVWECCVFVLPFKKLPERRSRSGAFRSI